MKTNNNFGKESIPFTQVANDVLNDKQLSMQAKGLYAYIYSKPNDWDFSFKRISEDMGNGTRSVLSTLKELERSGLLKRIKQSDGHTTYWVTFPPNNFVLSPSVENAHLGQKPSVRFRNLPKRQLGETHTISNKEDTSNKEEESKTSKPAKTQVLQGSQWNELIDAFKDVNPMYSEFYHNRSERSALESLAKQITFDKLLATIKQLPAIIQQPYAPRITSPTSLKRDLGKLLAFYKQEKNKPITRSTPNFIL